MSDIQDQFKANFVGIVIADPKLKPIGSSRHLLELFIVTSANVKKDEKGNPFGAHMWGTAGDANDEAQIMYGKINKLDKIRILGDLLVEEWEDRESGKRRRDIKLKIGSIEILRSANAMQGQLPQASPGAEGEPVAEDDIPF